MQVTFHLDVDDFLARCDSTLEANEPANGLMLGLCLVARAKRLGDEDFPIDLVSVADQNEELLGAAIRTPPRHLILSDAKADVGEALARALIDRGYELPGVIGPETEAERFAAAWEKVAGRRSRIAVRQMIYRLDCVQSGGHVSGKFRPATTDDLETVAHWFEDFAIEALEPFERVGPQEQLQSARRRIGAGTIFLWEDVGEPVSVAAVTAPTRNGIRVNAVYTPPAHRGRGYASANVAAVSQRQLDAGRMFCFLYTDASNATSNNLYRKVGYKLVARSRNYVFESGA